MRTIRFRGKRKDNGEWIYGGISIFNGDVDMFDFNSVDNGCYEVIPETVGQFIRCKDDKGNEIYEGDILRYQHCDNMDNDTFTEEAEVTTVRGFGVIHGNFDDFTVWSVEWASESDYVFELIGNVYDNPELLRQENI